MKSTFLRTGAFLLLSEALLISSATAADVVNEQSSITQKTTVVGSPTIIQHVDSKMEPTVVQSRQSTDPATGEKQQIVEPMIMERHEKVLDTTVIQPEVTETKTTTKQLLQSKTTKSTPAVHHVVRHRPQRVIHKTAYVPAKHVVQSNNTQLIETTQITKQPIIKETTIIHDQTSPIVVPEVIQKTETK